MNHFNHPIRFDNLNLGRRVEFGTKPLSELTVDAFLHSICHAAVAVAVVEDTTGLD